MIEFDMNLIKILKKEWIIMSEVVEILDGWYSLYLFYVVDWIIFCLIVEDDCEVMIIELEIFIKDKIVVRELY